MAIHIGRLIEEEVNRQRLTYKEFGAKIHRNEKTIPDIYERETMALDLLISISVALKKDFLWYYYQEPPMSELRKDDALGLQKELEKVRNENDRLTTELSHLKEVHEVTKESFSLAKDLIIELRSRTIRPPLVPNSKTMLAIPSS